MTRPLSRQGQKLGNSGIILIGQQLLDESYYSVKTIFKLAPFSTDICQSFFLLCLSIWNRVICNNWCSFQHRRLLTKCAKSLCRHVTNPSVKWARSVFMALRLLPTRSVNFRWAWPLPLVPKHSSTLRLPTEVLWWADKIIMTDDSSVIVINLFNTMKRSTGERRIRWWNRYRPRRIEWWQLLFAGTTGSSRIYRPTRTDGSTRSERRTRKRWIERKPGNSRTSRPRLHDSG